jgi:hypothetical protein
MARFVITLRGAVGPAMRSALADVGMTVEENVTLLRGDLADRAALNGVLDQLHGFGTEILEVRREDG